MYNTTNIGLCLFVQKLSEQCDFADTLDHMLRDRLVCGIWDVRVQRRLLAERLRKPMTWTKRRRQPRKALNICITHPVHAVSHPKNPTRQQTTVSCYRCGGKHATKDCQQRIFVKSEGEINSALRFAITHFTRPIAATLEYIASSQFKFENTAMRMEYTDSNDVISVLPKQPPSNEL